NLSEPARIVLDDLDVELHVLGEAFVGAHLELGGVELEADVDDLAAGPDARQQVVGGGLGSALAAAGDFKVHGVSSPGINLGLQGRGRYEPRVDAHHITICLKQSKVSGTVRRYRNCPKDKNDVPLDDTGCVRIDICRRGPRAA